MPYVMVPVPEEYEEEVMRELLKISLREKLSAWAQPELQVLLEQSDPASRRLIALLVRASRDQRQVGRAAAAAELSTDLESLDAVVHALNNRCVASGQPYLVLTSPMGEEQAIHITRNAVDLLVQMLDEAELVEP